MPVAPVRTITPPPLTGELPKQELAFENDYSNPQQGTGIRRRCMANQYPINVDVAAQEIQPDDTMNDNTITMKNSAAQDEACAVRQRPLHVPHHGRNQQPQRRKTHKIPPTLKDDRKLFVGGLPPSGTSGC